MPAITMDIVVRAAYHVVLAEMDVFGNKIILQLQIFRINCIEEHMILFLQDKRVLI